MSHDRRILAQLPPAIVDTFDFILTHRSGVTKRLWYLFRDSKLGSLQFATLVRKLHTAKFDVKDSSYHEHATNFPSTSRFPPLGNYTDRDGYGGFTPSTKYFSKLYMDKAAEDEVLLDQHMAMRQLTIGAIDHSHKVRTSFNPRCGKLSC